MSRYDDPYSNENYSQEYNENDFDNPSFPSSNNDDVVSILNIILLPFRVIFVILELIFTLTFKHIFKL